MRLIQCECQQYIGCNSNNMISGVGKTVYGLYLIARRRQPALVVVHTRDLAMQWVERVEEFLGIPGREVGMIGGGRDKVGQAVTVATVQSVYSRARELRKRIGHPTLIEGVVGVAAVWGLSLLLL